MMPTADVIAKALARRAAPVALTALQKAELELSQMMVDFLLDNLQPYLWTNKKAALDKFEDFLFRQCPPISDAMMLDIFAGRAGKGRGILETAGGISWRRGCMRTSSVRAINLVLHLLCPSQSPCMSSPFRLKFLFALFRSVTFSAFFLPVYLSRSLPRVFPSPLAVLSLFLFSLSFSPSLTRSVCVCACVCVHAYVLVS